MSENLLAQETSPYLLQHKDNPVHWRPWGEVALAEAQRLDKPILLSVGYAACHWCHVMAHESFEDPATAAVMNELFVNIKVDREERPDIDTIYQHALALMGEQGGWPLTMFCTPRGEPFWGGTYFPNEPRYGRPAFPDLLRRVAEIYRGEQDAVRHNVDALRQGLQRLSQSSAGEPVTVPILNEAARSLLQQVDATYGGIGPAPKFPNAPVIKLLWRAYKRTGQAPYRDAVLLTLTRMCQGGIYDHLGGGFARYSTDQYWLAPHFEKMLYDNAQLIDLLVEAWLETRNPLYAARARETVAWALREMIAEGGGFAATQDADSEGEEGRFYVWSEAEIDSLLGAESARFKAEYDVSAAGNWEGHTILNRSRREGLAESDTERALARARAILFAAREKRVKPGWDDKVLADWNGLMIAALARAALAFAEPAWLEAAERAFAFVRETMMRDGRLHHSFRAGQLRHAASLDDYANMIEAALALYEAKGEAVHLEQARAWVAALDRHYWDAAQGGYFFTADDVGDLIARTKTVNDNATPAGNGVMVAALARLYFLTGEDAYRRRAEAIERAFSGQLQFNLFPLATLLNAAEFLQHAVQVVLVGGTAEPGLEDLRRAAYGVSQPNRIVQTLAAGAALPPHHPARGKGLHGGKATAYVCSGPTCSLPITSADGLRAALSPVPVARHA
jgi:uncharacterized protein YyaL (SSP411 family)